MNFIIIFGPPAVGKMTVGHALSQLTSYKLFHNHMTIELVLNFFPFSPQFYRLVSDFRRRVFEEAAVSDLPCLICTIVWSLDDPGDKEQIDSYAAIFRQSGGDVYFVELRASQEERIGPDCHRGNYHRHRRADCMSRIPFQKRKRELETIGISTYKCSSTLQVLIWVVKQKRYDCVIVCFYDYVQIVPQMSTLRQIAFRTTMYESAESQQTDFDTWLHYYNYERTHEGYHNCGKRPIDTLNNYLQSIGQEFSSTPYVTRK
ncbi:MAG: AAA family ATPase [Caldilineaceae bacterium]|nr:AAA family ATPase [Caldilineaceae bacterium]